MKIIKSVVALLFAGVLFLPASATAAEYVVRPESDGACYLDDALKSAARVCGECLRDAGDKVVRKFRVSCRDGSGDDYMETEKLVTVSLECDGFAQPKPDEWWSAEAEEKMEDRLSLLSSASDACDLGADWPLMSKENIIDGAIAGALLAGVWLAVELADDKSEYTVKKKEGNNAAECRSKDKRLKGGSGAIKHCHNCRSAGGDNVAWKYDVYCAGERMQNQSVTVTLKCKNKMPDETEQKRLLAALAAKELRKKSASWSGCETRE